MLKVENVMYRKELVLIYMLMLKGYCLKKIYCRERQIARNVYRLMSGFIIFAYVYFSSFG